MSDAHTDHPDEREDKRSFLQKVAEFIHPGLESPQELINALGAAENNQVISPDARVMMERAIRMSDMTVKDIMVTTRHMDMLPVDAPYDALLWQVVTTAHSRFPVYEGDRENIIGVLMAKDLLKLQREPDFQLRNLLRPAAFVPESKGLHDLLREFRAIRNHLAIVIDEFGHVAGLVTIEDVLEQIVGEIEDEFDLPEDQGDIFGLADRTYRVSGETSVDRVCEAFSVDLQVLNAEDHFDTIGGLIMHIMGRTPRRGERLDAAGLRFTVLHTQGGAVRWFKVTRPVQEDPAVT